MCCGRSSSISPRVATCWRHAAGDGASNATRLHTLIRLVASSRSPIVPTVVAGADRTGEHRRERHAVAGRRVGAGAGSVVRQPDLVRVHRLRRLLFDRRCLPRRRRHRLRKGQRQGRRLHPAFGPLAQPERPAPHRPFGDLGRVTNLSRDWAAADFTLRFARDTDLDRLREATTKVSDDIMAVPELNQALLGAAQDRRRIADVAATMRWRSALSS